ncbi:MAG TPA: hypothetical protein VEC57_15095 [Candidatus Limnocylindrales bacterium]|nr:hypothetical protein [Candidatus Limnocylindrales bacterium]
MPLLRAIAVGLALLVGPLMLSSVPSLAQAPRPLPMTSTSSGGGTTCTASANQVLFFNGSSVCVSDPDMTFATDTLTVTKLVTPSVDSGVANTAIVLKSPTGSTAGLISIQSGATVRALVGGNASESYIQGQPSLPINFYNGAGSTVNMAILDAGALRIGSWTAALTAGALGLPKMTASGTAPGAAGLKLEVVCGTNAGSAKIIAYAGTSTTATTVLDNIGSGVTGC